MSGAKTANGQVELQGALSTPIRCLQLALAWTLAGGLGCAKPVAPPETAPPSRIVDMSVEVVKGQWPNQLNICIQPLGAPLTLASSGLPWANRYALFLAAFRDVSKGNEPLHASLPVSDPSPQAETIAKGERRCGRVSLESRFDGWRESLAAGDVHLFWAWHVKSGVDDEWLTGGVTVRRIPADGH